MNIEIWRDTAAPDPREYDAGFIKFVGRNTRYFSADEAADDLAATERQLRKEGAVYVPYSVYAHSGVRVWAGYPDDVLTPHGKWDKWHDGFAVIAKEDARREWMRGQKQVDRKRAKAYLSGVIETLAQWLSGDVWGYTITDDDGEIVESCGGFYGYDVAEGEAKAAAEAYK